MSEWQATSRIEHGDGVVDVSCRIDGESSVDRVTATVGPAVTELAHDAGSGQWFGQVVVSTPRRWFPHTHGEPVLHEVSAEVAAGEESVIFDQRPVGFRELDTSRWNDEVRLVVNDVEVFARGACWIPPDVVRIWSDENTLREALGQVVDAGMNLMRVPGTTVYEQPRFHELCDELGIMVWQDFMFANMQYPINDEVFEASVVEEASKQSRRLSHHPSTVVFCGGNEVEQQASMMGVSADVTDGHRLGSVLLRDVVHRTAPSVIYVVDSPSGGPLPFSLSSGVAHYFGVGAYLRPLEDARQAGVKFASECLAFANVPDRSCVDSFMTGAKAPQSPEWKAGVARDGGVGWDFDDVRDHYCRTVFGVDPLEIRYADPEQYLDLGRATSSFVIEQTITEWRRSRNPCSGAIVLQLRDVRPGAGWGLIDVFGRPKAAYYGMRRAAQPLALLMSDDGLDGLMLTVHNDRELPFAGTVEIRAVGREAGVAEVASSKVDVPPGQSCELAAAGMFTGFSDLTYAYRFGPLRHEAVVATLLDDLGREINTTHYLPGGLARPRVAGDVLRASARVVPEGVEVEVAASSLAQFVSLDFGDYVPDDNWFHLEPGALRVVLCRPLSSVARTGPAGEVRALNVLNPVFVSVQDPASG